MRSSQRSVIHRLTVIFLFATLAGALAAQPVPAEEELLRFRNARPELIDFESRPGARTSRSRWPVQIGWGEQMGWRVRWAPGPHRIWDKVGATEHLETIDRFIIERRYAHQVGAPYGADVIELINVTGGDIGTIKRILAGYLYSSFEYPPERCERLADMILAYNRMIRKEMTLLRGRYAPEVLALLEEHKVGIEKHYFYWSGRTQILVPLMDRDVARADALNRIPDRPAPVQRTAPVLPPPAQSAPVPARPIQTQPVPRTPAAPPANTPVVNPRPDPTPSARRPKRQKEDRWKSVRKR